jgi:hypothetical protein
MAVHELSTQVTAPAQRPERSFYPVWILLTTLCIPAAFVLDLAVLRLIIDSVGDYIYVDGVRRITEDYLGVPIFMPIAGLLTGVLQYALLRRYLPRMGWWVPATLVGWSLGYLLIAIPGRVGWTDALLKNIDLMFLVMGLSIGLAQWLLLRGRLPLAGGWIAANILGWGLLRLVTSDNSVGQLGLLVIGLVPACTTAATLAWLMDRLPGME